MIDSFYLNIVLSYILVCLFGILIGNFTTTAFHRLPRNIMICGIDKQNHRAPFCSFCGHLLKFYEYLPILSWFSTFGKCNYCHATIPKSYMMLEMGLGIIAVILYFLFGENLEYFFIYFCLASLILLSVFIYFEHKYISKIVTFGIIILGMIFRTLIDHEIFSWLSSLTLGFILSLWLMQSNKENILPHFILPASLWCNNQQLLIFGIILSIVSVIKKYCIK